MAPRFVSGGHGCAQKLAERVGFEPTIPCGIPVFELVAVLSHKLAQVVISGKIKRKPSQKW